jgi:transcription initiation factor IIE alpha subunit
MENKYQEALDIACGLLPHEQGVNISEKIKYMNEHGKTYRDTLQELVDRATPMEGVYNESGYPHFTCPKCDRELGYDDDIKFCKYCGQALKWEGKDD